MAREIDLDNKLIKETPVVPQQLFFNNFSDNIKDEFPFEVPSSSTQPPFQDFHRLNHHHHHDQFHPDIGSSPNPVMEVQTGSNFDPFDAFPYGTSSATMDFFEYDIKPFGDTSSTHHHHPVIGHHGQVMDNFQVGGGEYLNLPMLPQRNHPIDLVGSNQYHNHININPQGEMSMHYNGANSSSSNNNNRAPPSIRRTSGKYRKKNTVVKGQWTAEEDRVLVQLVEQHGIRKWSLIAQMLPGRIGKQCRERWHNHLRPDIKKDTWSEEEDRVLIQAHAEIGNKWAEIAKRLPGRTENSIKNHWNATKRRQYSKRKCRSKYPRGSLLQEYIKSLNLDAPVASTAIAGAGRVENGKASVTDNANMGISNNNSTIDTTVKVPNCLPQELDFCLNDRLVPTFDFNEMVIPDFDFDEKMFQEGGCCNIDTLLDEIPCAPVVEEKGFCVDDVPCEDVSTVLMDSEVEKEMDLVDMISQS